MSAFKGIEKRLAGALPFYLFTLLLLSCGVDSDKFRLEGRLRNIHQGEFWVYSMDGSIDGIDTIPVREGRFSYEIPLRSPSTLIVIFPTIPNSLSLPSQALRWTSRVMHLT